MLLQISCSPTFNWREIQLDGAPLRGMLPCKPDQRRRELPLLDGQPTMVNMIGCKAGEVTFVLAWADVKRVELASKALTAWQTASLAQLKEVSKTQKAWAITQAGSRRESSVVRLQGLQPGGAPVVMESMWFSSDSHVFQALIFGGEVAENISEPFFSSLMLQ